MNNQIVITPAKQEHYDEIMKIYNEAFLPKFRFIIKSEQKQASFAHDMGLIDLDIPGREYVALSGSKVMGFLSLRSSLQKEKKSYKTNLSYRDLFVKYGFLGIIRSLIFDNLMTYHPPQNELYIESVCVGTDARGMGVGTLLLDYAYSYAREKGLAKMSLYVMTENPRAKALYERFGFVNKSYRKLGLLRKSTGYSGFYFMVKDLDER